MTRSASDIAKAARDASRAVATLSTEIKNRVLLVTADLLDKKREAVLRANDADMARASDLDEARRRRLRLTSAGIDQLCDGLRQVASLTDPVGVVTSSQTRPNGLRVERVRCPIGVIAMIYEARPGVTIDAFALCFKAGNACILKGGREAGESNTILGEIVGDALASCGVARDAMAALVTSDRGELTRLLQCESDIDLVIPRGGESLIRFVKENSKIPTVQHFHGVCHVYVDSDADLETAVNIVATGKTGAPSACNATECVLIHDRVASAFVPMLAARAAKDRFVIRGDEQVVSIARRALAGAPNSVEPASADDFGREFLDLILAARVVPSFDEAVRHVERYGSNHTDAIVSRNDESCRRWCARVGSSCVLVNASTRFNDGYQLGLGAEIGISTQRVHAYGPMGLEELTVQRYVVTGSGQVR